MLFPICLTVNESYLIAVIKDNYTDYMLISDALRYETCERAFVSDSRELKKIVVDMGSEGGVYFSVSISDITGAIQRSYREAVLINVNSGDFDVLVPGSLLSAIYAVNPGLEAVAALKETFIKISEELAEQAQSLKETGYLQHPLVAASKRQGIVFTAPDGFDTNTLLIDTTPVYTEIPTDKIFLPVPSTQDIIRVNAMLLSEPEDDFMLDLQKSSEFGSSSAYHEYLESSVKMGTDDIIATSVLKYVNKYYAIEQALNVLPLPQQEKELRIELAKVAADSIYLQNNLRVLGVDVEPTGPVYQSVYGKPDYDDDIYSNEGEFRECLRNLMYSVLMYEHKCFSVRQLLEKTGGGVKSDWFESYILAQIQVVLQDMYACTGKVAPISTSMESDEEDSDLSDSSEEVTKVSSGQQLLRIAKAIDNSFSIAYPSEDEYIMKVRSHELDPVAGFNSVAWYIRDINNCEGSIDALIQLLRFGERKSQYVHVIPDGADPKYPYLDTRLLSTTRVINVEHPYELVRTESGHDYSMEGVLTLGAPIDGNVVQLPLGVILCKTESNGVDTRQRMLVYDINRFLNDIMRTNSSDGSMYLSVEGFSIVDGVLVYNTDYISKAVSNEFSAVNLETQIRKNSDSLIVDPRTGKKQLESIGLFCKEAGIPFRVDDAQFTFISALAMLETGEIAYSRTESIRFDPNSPEKSVYKRIIRLYTETMLKNQEFILSRKQTPSIFSILDFVIAKMKSNRESAPVATDKSLFDTILTDTENYSIIRHALLKRNDKTVGYAYQCKSKEGKQLLLVSGASEIGLRMPVNKTNTYAELDVSKVLEKQQVRDFYTAKDLNSQIQLVGTAHSIVLASINTVKYLREDL